MLGMTSVADPIVYLDSCVFIDALEGTPEIAKPAQMLIEYCRNNAGVGITSELTIAESAFFKPLPHKEVARRRAAGEHVRTSFAGKRAYFEILIWGGGVDLEPVSREILMETLVLRQPQKSKVKLPDAIHLATAWLKDCRYFASRDKHIRLPDDMRKLATLDDIRDAIESGFQR